MATSQSTSGSNNDGAVKKNGEVSDEPKLVQARLSPQTYNRLKHLESLVEATSRTQAIASAITLAEIILSETREHDGTIYIEREDGTTERIQLAIAI